MQVSLEIVHRIEESLRGAHVQMRDWTARECARLDRELAARFGHIDGACLDKLDGKISGLGAKKGGERMLDLTRILGLSQTAHLLYLPRKPDEQVELPKKRL